MAKTAKTVKRCPKGSRRDTKTGKCVPKTQSNKNNTFVNAVDCTSKCDNVTCPSNKICNPPTGKCVLKTGAIGKKILEGAKMLKEADRKLERLEAHAPPEIKEYLRDLRSEDPETRDVAERALEKESRKNSAMLTFLKAYYKELILILVPFMIYQMGIGPWVSRSITGWYATKQDMQMAAAAGPLVPYVRTSMQFVEECLSKTGISTAWTTFWGFTKSMFKDSVPEPYQWYEYALESLKAPGPPKDHKLLLSVYKGLEKDIKMNKCVPGQPAVQFANKFEKMLRGVRHDIDLRGGTTTNIDTWIQAFARLKSLCT
jgi:hypothetical protein